MMKKSKLQRKFVNQMRNMGDIPWPARRFHYAPTLSSDVRKEQLLGSCKRPVGEAKVRAGWLRRRKTIAVPCGGRVFLKRGSLGKRRVFCEACRARKHQRAAVARMSKRINRLSPREQTQEQRRETSRLRRFMRQGTR